MESELRLTVKPRYNWVLKFVAKIFGWIVFLNLLVLPILWALNLLHLFTLISMYEATFILILGLFQILGARICKEDTERAHIPYRMPFRTYWFDFKKFSNLKPRERQRYRQEGIIMAIVGLALFVGSLIKYFYIFFYP
jgi:hypothetical protein